MPKHVSITEDVKSLAPSAIIVLYELDATSLGESSVLYFHNGTNSVGAAIVWNGISYQPLPILVTGFEVSSEGKPPRPKLMISNVGGWVSALVQQYDDLTGATLTRRRTFARYLDGMPDAGPVELPPDIFIIDRKTNENRISVEFELAASIDLDGINMPRRLVTANYCSWRYRGDGCGFAVPLVFTLPTGLAAAGMGSYRGAWSESRVYETGQSAYYANADGATTLFVALQEANGVSVLDTDYWNPVQTYVGNHDQTASYSTGDVVRVVGDREYLAIALQNVPANTPVTSAVYWGVDTCFKHLSACQMRFDPADVNKPLPYGGFPGTANLPEVP